MTRSHGKRRLLGTLLLPLLAATLACSALTGPAGPSGAVLTQAAATVTAAAHVAATALAAAPTTAPILTEAPTAATTPTTAPGATALATEASTATLGPSAADTLTPEPGEAVVLDPCTLISSGEVASLMGVTAGTPKPQFGGCEFLGAGTSISSVVVLYALPASQSPSFFQQNLLYLRISDVRVDAAASAKFDADVQAGDTVASLDDLIAMSLGQPKFNAQKVDGLGSAALWSWNSNAARNSQNGDLLVARPGVVVSLRLIVGSSITEAGARPLIQPIVKRILANLPASFTVPGLQVVGSAPALDLCSLASPADAETILGDQARPGVVQYDACRFADAADHSVSVSAVPAGVTAANDLLAEAAFFSNDLGANSRLAADANAGDLVAAVRDMATMGHSGGGLTLENIPGLGDSAVLLIMTADSTRLSTLFVARPGVLVNIEVAVSPGNDAATKKAEVALMMHILAILPAKFTVSGVP
jgi:hypothetical protein